MASETIKEFLVSLGFRVDANSNRKFEESIANATKAALGLAAAVAAAATAINGAVLRISRSFEDLYYQSQRTKASAENIKAFSYAVSQLGGSAGGALQSLEQFGRNLRTNPGYESFLKALGVQTRNAKGQARDTVEVLQDLDAALKRKFPGEGGYYQRLNHAQFLGIDEDTFRAIESGEFTRRLDEYRQTLRALGVDQEAADKSSKELWQSFRELLSYVDALGAKLVQELGPSLREAIERIKEFIKAHSDDIVDGLRLVGEAVQGVTQFMGRLVDATQPLAAKFGEISQSILGQDGLKTALEALAGVLALSVLGRLGSLLGLLAGLASRLLSVRTILLGIIAYVANDLLKTPEQKAEEAKDNPYLQESPWDSRYWARRIVQGARRAWNHVTGGGGAAASTGESAGGGGEASTSTSGGRRFELTPDQAKEMHASIEATARRLGVSPGDLAAAMSYETGGTLNPWQRGPTTKYGTHRGLIQWGEPQAQEYGVTRGSTITQQIEAVGRYLRDRGVRPGMGLLDIYAAINAGRVGRYGASDAGNGGAPGTVAQKVATIQRSAHIRAFQRLAALAGGAESAPVPQVSNSLIGTLYDRAATATGGTIAPLGPPPSSVTGDTNVNLNQKTEINVIGTSDPAGTAAAVAGQQGAVNGNLQRNFQGAVR